MLLLHVTDIFAPHLRTHFLLPHEQTKRKQLILGFSDFVYGGIKVRLQLTPVDNVNFNGMLCIRASTRKYIKWTPRLRLNVLSVSNLHGPKLSLPRCCYCATFL